MGNIIKLQLEEKIRFLILRYPRNLEKVVEEASRIAGTEIPISLIMKIREKFRRKQGKDVNYMVACNLAQEMIFGSQERLAKLEAMYIYWDGKEEALESVCCNAPVKKYDPADGSPPYYRCVKCDNTCGTRVVRALELEKLKMRLIKEMRSESDHLLKFAKTMGFVAPSKEENTPTAVNKNYIIVDGRKEEGNESKRISVDSEMASTAENLSPMDRAKLLEQLDGMLETEFVDKKEETGEIVGQ